MKNELDEEERIICAEYKRYLKAMRAARIANPRLNDLFQEVQKKEKIASCEELRSMLEKVRLLLDNVEWEDEPEWDLVFHIWNRLLNQFRKRCREMWIKYTDELAPKLVKRMEEALLWDTVKPRKT